MITAFTLVTGLLVIMPISAVPQEAPPGFSRASLKASVKLAATPPGKAPIQLAIFAFFARIG
jgi:hypothetical protein